MQADRTTIPGLQRHLREAMQLTLAGRLDDATRVIQRAMSEAAGEPAVAPGDAGAAPAAPASPGWDIDAAPRVLDSAMFGAGPPSLAVQAERAGAGSFGAASYRDGPRQGQYKLYVPPGHAGRLLPLVVMLHGCTQDADDFAAGTAMNEHAREQGFFVLYPEQSRQSNGARCWNWFKPAHRQRGSGEPGLIAGMTGAVMQRHGIDKHRIYVAGLSAGGAMAAIVAAAYPEIFAAAGVHSGLPRDATNGLALAFMAMGPAAAAAAAAAAPEPAVSRPGKAVTVEEAPAGAVPTIVFHGDHDTVVHPANGERVIAVALHHGLATGAPPAPAPQCVESGQAAGGRAFTRTVYLADGQGAGPARAEHWLVHGAGHAWSGGRAEGSYTDPAGPDATREMLRFFAAHPLR